MTNRNHWRRYFSDILNSALWFGLFLFFIQYGLAGPVVASLSGTAVESIPFGVAYARIRAFAAPVAIPTIVAQAAFLAAKDAVTPLKATLIGAVINLIGMIVAFAIEVFFYLRSSELLSIPPLSIALPEPLYLPFSHYLILSYTHPPTHSRTNYPLFPFPLITYSRVLPPCPYCLGDIVLVTLLGWGIAGAALATVASQYAGAVYLLYVAARALMRREREKRRWRWWKEPEAGVDAVDVPAPTPTIASPPRPLAATSNTSARVLRRCATFCVLPLVAMKKLLQPARAALNLLAARLVWPSPRDVGKYLTFCGPLFAVLLTKTTLWSFTTFAAAAGGAVDLAAHQISLNIFLFFLIFGDVVG